jgi:hypothetical protein
MNLVILTEEQSMKTTLIHLLPKLGIDMTEITIIPHQGRSDLEKSIPRKLKAWNTPNSRFLILRDNDRGDCKDRKAQLLAIVAASGKLKYCKVRVVCQELEAWFLADVPALQSSGYLGAGKVPGFAQKDPDAIPHPVHEMEKLRPGYGKITGAAEIAPYMNPDNPKSASFIHTIQAIRDMIAL